MENDEWVRDNQPNVAAQVYIDSRGMLYLCTALGLRRHRHSDASSLYQGDELTFFVQVLCVLIAAHVLAASEQVRGSSLLSSTFQRRGNISVVVHLTDDRFGIGNIQPRNSSFRGVQCEQSLFVNMTTF